MAAGQKKIYIAKDGEILYGEQRDEYLHDHASDEDEFADSSEMYIKGGNILHGREALKEKMADDVRDALKQSGINKWLDKLENEAKEKMKENEKQSKDPSDEKEGSSAMAVAENLSDIHKKLPSKVQNSPFGKTLKTAEDACKKHCDTEHSSTDIAENVVTEIHKKLPSKVKSATAKGLEATKGAWKAGQGAIKTATEAGKVIQGALTGDLPAAELNVSGDADFTGNFQGHVTPMQKTSNRVRVGEAQLQLKGHLHDGTQFSSKINGKTMTVDGEFDGAVSANAEFVGADIEVGGNTKQETHEVKDTKQNTKQQSAAVEATNKNEKTYKVKARFEGQANASAKGVNVRINTHKSNKPHTTGEMADFEINATAQAQATGINVDMMTINKPKPKNNDSSETKNHPKPKLRVQGKASTSATAADVKVGNKLTVEEESDVKTLEAHVHAEAKGCEVQIGNRIEKPKFKGGSASAKVQASGAALRVGNIQKSESEKGVGATAEARVAGAELNMGNVSLDKGSSLGVAAVKEVKTGLTAFNVQAGAGGKTGIKVSTDVQFGNVACNLGPSALNISPFAFNLGFGGGIKGSAGIATKGNKGSTGKGDGSSSDGCESSAGGSHRSDSSSGIHGTTASHNSGYPSGGSFSTINGGNNNASSHEMSGSGSQFEVSGNSTSDNSTANHNKPRKINSHRGDAAKGGSSSFPPHVTNEGIRSGSTHGSGNSNGLGGGNGAGSNLHNAGDENGSILYLEGNSHSASQFAYSSSSDTTSNHTYSTSGQHNNTTTGHTGNAYGNSRSSTSRDYSHSGGYGHTHSNSTVNYSTNNAASAVGQHKSRKSKSNDLASTSTAAAGQATNRKSNLVNTGRPTLSNDDQTTLAIGDEEHVTFHNPHRLPRKLNEETKSQANAAVPSKRSSQGHQTSDLQPGKHSSSSNDLLGGATHSSTKNEVTGKKKSDLDDDLSRKLSLALSKRKASSKKAEKSKTTSRQETKEKLTEELTKVRKELEAEDNSTGKASSTDEDNTTGQSKERTSSSKSSSADVKSHSTDQQATDDVEEVAIPDDKKKPFGTHSNIFTMDCIRASTYKVQTSNKPLQKIGSNVMGFK